MKTIFIDCSQEIPCNPCQTACQTGAISVPQLTARPVIVAEKCVGCDNCVAICPGQACFLIDLDYTSTEATIDFPFEFLPVPQVGQWREARDNQGNTLCLGQVVAVLERPMWKGTRVIRLAVDKSVVYQVRGMSPAVMEELD